MFFSRDEFADLEDLEDADDDSEEDDDADEDEDNDKRADHDPNGDDSDDEEQRKRKPVDKSQKQRGKQVETRPCFESLCLAFVTCYRLPAVNYVC